jgi:hypothetical protein
MDIQTSEDWLRQEGRLAEVDGQPTYVFATLAKNDLSVMLRCCEAEAEVYWRQAPGDRISAAPFFFERAAILLRKQRRYADEVAVCEQWQSIAKDYQTQPAVHAGRMALVHLGPRSVKILERLEKARALLQAQCDAAADE